MTNKKEISFIGSCADDAIGCGTLLLSDRAISLNDTYCVFFEGKFVECYDVMKITEEGIESPDIDDLEYVNNLE